MNHFEYFIFKYKVMIKNLMLKNIYKSISKPVNYEENYIYYPGPYIPEAMSNIVPGKFEDPFVILDMLSAKLLKVGKYITKNIQHSPLGAKDLWVKISIFMRN